MTLKLSRTSKLDNIASWSVPAWDYCPGKTDPHTQQTDPVCSICYARNGNYRFKNVKAARQHNVADWQRDDWADDMVAALDNQRYFRWFDSGDMYDLRLAQKILEVVQRTPWVSHWLPTRMHRFTKFHSVLEALSNEPNCALRASTTLGGEIHRAGSLSSIVTSRAQDAPEGTHVCAAYENPGQNCNGCRACWDKDVAQIAYVAHGQQSRKYPDLIARAA